jgi:hypothetical protein
MIADQEREDSTCVDSYTTSIASDPLIQFAIVFSALIHDVDHAGKTDVSLSNYFGLPLFLNRYASLLFGRSPKRTIDQGRSSCCHTLQQQVSGRTKLP